MNDLIILIAAVITIAILQFPGKEKTQEGVKE